MKGNFFLIEIDFLNTRSGQSYFLPANQNVYLTTHELIKICVVKIKLNLWQALPSLVDGSDFSFESS